MNDPRTGLANVGEMAAVATRPKQAAALADIVVSSSSFRPLELSGFEPKGMLHVPESHVVQARSLACRGESQRNEPAVSFRAKPDLNAVSHLQSGSPASPELRSICFDRESRTLDLSLL